MNQKLMKITYMNFGPLTADFMLTFGLLTEAVIFTIAGVRGYVLLKDNNVFYLQIVNKFYLSIFNFHFTLQNYWQ